VKFEVIWVNGLSLAVRVRARPGGGYAARPRTLPGGPLRGPLDGPGLPPGSLTE